MKIEKRLKKYITVIMICGA